MSSTPDSLPETQTTPKPSPSWRDSLAVYLQPRVAILLLALTDPARSPLFVALGALLVAAMSSTQDIVVDAFRVESLPESEQAATEPAQSAQAEAATSAESAFMRVLHAAVGAFSEFLGRRDAFAALAFVVL